MKYRLFLLALPFIMLGCKEKDRRTITYDLHPHAGYPSYGTATFTEGPKGSDNTGVNVNLYNLTPGESYVGHIHPGDTATYNSSPIILHLGSFMPTGSEYQLFETWEGVTFDEVLDYDGCVAVHSPAIGVAIGNIGRNAE